MYESVGKEDLLLDNFVGEKSGMSARLPFVS